MISKFGVTLILNKISTDPSRPINQLFPPRLRQGPAERVLARGGDISQRDWLLRQVLRFQSVLIDRNVNQMRTACLKKTYHVQITRGFHDNIIVADLKQMRYEIACLPAPRND